MDVAEGHEVGGNHGLVGLLQARVVERTRHELARRGIGFGRRLVRVQWSSIVSRGPELVARGMLIPEA